ncbi:MAG: hypothetical protein KC613_24655, partial [Myxococcales bacterium]|nr:hypothetical protein [Myxococcales bacterium]
AGPATVGGPVTVGGRLSAGAVTAGWIAAQSARFDRLSVTGIGGADVTRGGLVLAQPLVAGSFTSNAAAVPVGRLTSPVTLVDGALSVPGGLTLTGSLTLSGVTRLTFSDNRQPVALLNGELTLNPNNSYNGGTIINSRALQFASINHHGRLWAGSLVTSSTVINAPDSTLTVAGAATAAATTVAGGLSVPDCRICLTYGSPGVRSKRVCAHADVGTGRNASATLALNGPVDGAHNFGMTYVCDGARTNEAGFFP